jgi:bifunctional non-homologous end joining protein LigD
VSPETLSAEVDELAQRVSTVPVNQLLMQKLVVHQASERASGSSSKPVHEQEVVIVGYTEPRKSRKFFGSLVLAVRDKANKRWVYAGHVGAGFDQAALRSIYETMQPLRTDKKPFDQKVQDENMITWLIPKLVGEVKFTEWTSENEMRHPVFLGLRTDKKASGVIREEGL